MQFCTLLEPHFQQNRDDAEQRDLQSVRRETIKATDIMRYSSRAGTIAKQMVGSAKLPEPAAAVMRQLADQQAELAAPNGKNVIEAVKGRFFSPMSAFLPSESCECEFYVLKPPKGVQHKRLGDANARLSASATHCDALCGDRRPQQHKSHARMGLVISTRHRPTTHMFGRVQM
jgi:hypothetical protein